MNVGIPPIIGVDVDSFVATMKSYQSGACPNPAMVSVAKSLDDEQLRALEQIASQVDDDIGLELCNSLAEASRFLFRRPIEHNLPHLAPSRVGLVRLPLGTAHVDD